jgi:hypothetical protein
MQQAEALKIMQMGFNVLLTGEAGAGKTYTLNKFIDWAHSHHIPIALTASTGIAATHIGGVTIHSFSGIGIKDQITKKDLDKLARRADILKKFVRCKILVIDEISMLSANFLDNLNLVCKHIKMSPLPFGGLQVILAGDIFQLPPISRGQAVKLALQSQAWRELKPVVCYLKEQHRQNQADPLSLILNRIRTQSLQPEDLRSLASRLNQDLPEDQIITKLYSHNADVDSINLDQLSQINAPQKVFNSILLGNKVLAESIQKSCLAPAELKLKLGAEVMFVKNDPAGRYVNGTRGHVVNFANDGGWPIVKTTTERIIVTEPATWSIQDEQGQDLAAVQQVPLRLAWAVTIHKSQGLSLDAAKINLGRVFEYGMGYVALSRVKSLSGLYLEDFNDKSLQINPNLIKINQQLLDHSDLAAGRLAKLSRKELQQKIDSSILNLGGTLKSNSEGNVKGRAADLKPASTARSNKIPRYQITIDLILNRGLSLEQAAKERSLTLATITSHLAQHIQLASEPKAELKKFKALKPPKEDITNLKSAHKELTKLKQKPTATNLKKQLAKSGYNLSYPQIQLALIWV